MKLLHGIIGIAMMGMALSLYIDGEILKGVWFLGLGLFNQIAFYGIKED